MEQPITRKDHARWNRRFIKLHDAAEHARAAKEILLEVASEDPAEANAILAHATDQCASAAVNIDGLAQAMLPQPEAPLKKLPLAELQKLTRAQL